jgi:hypothetical protein
MSHDSAPIPYPCSAWLGRHLKKRHVGKWPVAKVYDPATKKMAFVGIIEVSGLSHVLHKFVKSEYRYDKIGGYSIQAEWFASQSRRRYSDIVVYEFDYSRVTIYTSPFALWLESGVRYQEQHGVQICLPDAMQQNVRVVKRSMTKKQRSAKRVRDDFDEISASIS